jgi:hypothetical protein
VNNPETTLTNALVGAIIDVSKGQGTDPRGVRKGYTMKQFTITYVSQRFFGQGFARHTEQVLGAKAALRMLKSIRGGKNPALVVWVSCR